MSMPAGQLEANRDPFALRADLAHIPMCRPSGSYKPFTHGWADLAQIQQQKIHWLPEEAPMGMDANDYKTLEPAEKSLIDNILKLFTQSDIDVANNYMTLYQPIFRNGEIARMLRAFASMEDTHVRAYSLLLETLGLGDSHYNAFLEVEEMRAKHDLLTGYTMKDPIEIATTLALIGGFGEGLALFSSFAMLLNFGRFAKMKGMCQIVTWSIRDETLHVEGIIKLFHEFCHEAGITKAQVKEGILRGARDSVMLEDAFIDRAFELGPVKGLTPADMKLYIRYTADYRLQQLGIEPIYNIEDHPLGWLQAQLNAVEHANFFETKSTEYSKGGSKGHWSKTWEQFDEAEAPKIANDDALAAAEKASAA
jgi:ribonucleoside-diphosphate reductase beta chain